MKNGAKVYEQKKKNAEENVTNSYSSKPIDSILKRRLVEPNSDSITPHGSTRSLLSDKTFSDGSSDYDSGLVLTKVDDKKDQVVGQNESNPASKSGSSSQVSFLFS